MKKQRVLLVDTEVQYLEPIKLKLLREYHEHIDLEVITNQYFFEQLFSVPQQVDILIILESLYNPSLQRHQIGHVFLMTENQEEETAELGVDRIFKYKNVQEILSKIITVGEIGGDAPQEETKIITVCAGEGGTGKTTLSLGLCAYLAQNFKKVLYVNAGTLHSFQCRMKEQSALSAAQVFPVFSLPEKQLYTSLKSLFRNEGFHYLAPFQNALMALDMQKDIYAKIALAAKQSGEFDYVVLDTEGGFDEENANMLNIADRVLVVLTQAKASVFATKALISNIHGVNAEKYSFICNQYKQTQHNALLSLSEHAPFSISCYVHYFEQYDSLSYEDYAQIDEIQKLAVLLL